MFRRNADRTGFLTRRRVVILGALGLLCLGATVPAALADTPGPGAAAPGVPSAGPSSSAANPTAGSAAGAGAVAPYVDLGILSNGGSLADLAKQSGLKDFTLAFTTGGGCTPSFPAGADFLKQQIGEVRAAGGDVTMSFGGATGAELAQSCTDQAQLEQAYASVADQFDIDRFDMDIEGAAVADQVSIDRRSKALAALQQKNPKLTVSLTLPVLPTGLTDGVKVVQSAKDNGVKLGVVNIMAMDYGANDTGDRGDEAIQAAKATLDQLKSIFGSQTDFSMLGVTPMLGENDDHAIFNQDDAKQLVDFAQQNNVGYLGSWELNRDAHACTGALFSCTNIAQQPLEFAKIFAAR